MSVVWAMEPEKLGVAALGRYRVLPGVVSLSAELPTSVAVGADCSVQYRLLAGQGRLRDGVGE